MRISDAMANARLSRNLSVRELADRAGVTANTIWGWERGTALPQLLNAEAVAHALGITIDEYIGSKVPEDE